MQKNIFNFLKKSVYILYSMCYTNVVNRGLAVTSPKLKTEGEVVRMDNIIIILILILIILRSDNHRKK